MVGYPSGQEYPTLHGDLVEIVERRTSKEIPVELRILLVESVRPG